MFCLNVALGNTAWRLLYRDEEKARAAHNTLCSMPAGNFFIVDDFGQELGTKAESVHGFMLEDLGQTKLAHAELMLHGERIKILAQKMAQTDPGLRTQPMNGPAIISPMSGFPRNN